MLTVGPHYRVNPTGLNMHYVYVFYRTVRTHTLIKTSFIHSFTCTKNVRFLIAASTCARIFHTLTPLSGARKSHVPISLSCDKHNFVVTIINTPALSVGVGIGFSSQYVCLSCLSVCPQNNSKTNDPKVFKPGVGVTLGYTRSGTVLGFKR